MIKSHEAFSRLAYREKEQLLFLHLQILITTMRFSNLVAEINQTDRKQKLFKAYRGICISIG